MAVSTYLDVASSRAPVGSSRNSMVGLRAKARAMATRDFSPPLSCENFVSDMARSLRPKVPATLRNSPLTLSPETPKSESLFACAFHVNAWSRKLTGVISMGGIFCGTTIAPALRLAPPLLT
mmetsp:Transcript_26762/g.53351  ORF Transcript_26762/g.53351 Transcript_26762/m.53351 type:complete len:122 (-) Transcript_26762:1242-1607(-)